jgi:lipopolysaccharide/colanic/teichoic acid biosynthesis glycosyltransferase
LSRSGLRKNSALFTSKTSPHKSVTGRPGFLKRSLDVVGSASALILLSPLLAAIAALVRMVDGGPVFYRQIRVGLCGRHFKMIKFRTMQQDAEKFLGAIWSVPGDPRCTRLGRRLRRFGADELPQLWNILRGDMSLVGPRPERPEFIREFRSEHGQYDLRHSVRPGLTGFAQINGWRGYTSIEERLRHDLHYVEHWSLWLDFYVLALLAVRGWSESTRDGIKKKFSL